MSYVQFGCGYSAPEGWLNFDSSPTLRLEKLPIVGKLVRKNVEPFPSNVMIGDIVKGLPVPNSSADGVYASHILEHLTKVDFQLALQNTYKILKGGGIFRLIVPDLEARARGYVDRLNAGSTDANDWFMVTSHLGLSSRPKNAVAKVSRVFGGSLHLWMWDFQSLQRQLEEVGFVRVRRCALGDSGDSMFDRVENPKRFYDEDYGIPELAVEARKSQ